MSHRLIAKVGAGAFSRSVLDRACVRRNLQPSHYQENYNIEGTQVSGHSVAIPGFAKLAIFKDGPVLDTTTRRPVLDVNGNPQLEVQVHYDNYTFGGRYADVAPLEALKAEYNQILEEDNLAMVEEAREIARRNNQATQVREEEDGVVVLTVQLGG
jgi:hypothetical protein